VSNHGVNHDQFAFEPINFLKENYQPASATMGNIGISPLKGLWSQETRDCLEKWKMVTNGNWKKSHSTLSFWEGRTINLCSSELALLLPLPLLFGFDLCVMALLFVLQHYFSCHDVPLCAMVSATIFVFVPQCWAWSSQGTGDCVACHSMAFFFVLQHWQLHFTFCSGIFWQLHYALCHVIFLDASWQAYFSGWYQVGPSWYQVEEQLNISNFASYVGKNNFMESSFVRGNPDVVSILDSCKNKYSCCRFN